MTQIVKMAGRDLAIGLTWVSEIGEDDKTTARKVLGSTRGLRQAVVFSDPGSGMTFVGFDESSTRWLKVPSAAAWMAQAQEEGSRGVLVQRVAGDDYWVVAVGHQQVLFETDLVLSARAAAEHVETLLARVPDMDVMVGPDCEEVLAEALWQPAGVGTFDQFFADSKPPRAAYARQIIGVSRQTGLIAIGVGVAVIVAALGFGFQEYQRRAEEEARRAMAAQQAAAEASELERERERRIQAAVRAAVSKDTKVVDPEQLVAACHGLASRLGHLTFAGWHLERVQCAGERQRAELFFRLQELAEGGTGDASSLALLREQLNAEGLKTTGSIGGRGYEGKLTVQLALPERGGITEVDNLPLLERILNGWFSALQRAFQGLPGDVRWTAPTPRAVTYKDPEAEKTAAARRNPARAMRPVPPEKSFRSGTVRLDAPEVFVVASLLKAMEARNWLTLTSARFEIGAEGSMRVTIDVKYFVQ